MRRKNEDFVEIFYEESIEGLQFMESELLEIQIGVFNRDIIDAIFRAAHSIKGGCGSFGFKEMEEYTHVVETVLDRLRNQEIELVQDLKNSLLESVDVMRNMLNAIRNKQTIDEKMVRINQDQFQAYLNIETRKVGEKPSSESIGVQTWKISFKPFGNILEMGNDPVLIIRELNNLGQLETQVNHADFPDISQLQSNEVILNWEFVLHAECRIQDIEEIFSWIEDECDLKIEQINQHAENSVDAKLGTNKSLNNFRLSDTNSIRVNIDKIDYLINMMGELVITQSMLEQIERNFHTGQRRALRDGIGQLKRNTRDMQESIMRIRMLPIGNIFSRFPRLIHDLCSKLDKQVDLIIEGEQTEVDKTVLEKIADPMVHLIRNALDHGLESVEERRANHKPETGTLRLTADNQGGHININIIDDGRGLDHDKILAKAIEKSIVKEDANLSPQEIDELIFASGFSTAKTVSEVSGRGVGMDVVKNNIQSIGGTVSIRSNKGRGTTINIKIPLTLAIMDGQTIVIEDEQYIVPVVAIVESIRVRPGMITSLTGKGETFQLRGEPVALLRLDKIFNIKRDTNSDTAAPVINKTKNAINTRKAIRRKEELIVVVEGDGRQVGLLVDNLLAQQQVVIKSLETNLKKIDGISAATVLGDGSVGLILDVAGLIRTYASSKSESAAA